MVAEFPSASAVTGAQRGFDYSITWGESPSGTDSMSFLSGASKDYPYLRESLDFEKTQFDTADSPGEQSLSGWWLRSQSSFDLGAGVLYVDAQQDDSLLRRFSDSSGVDSTLQPGVVSMQRKCSNTLTGISGDAFIESYSISGTNGVVYANGSTLKRITSAGTETTINWDKYALDGVTVENLGGTIRALTTNGGSYYVVATGGIYAGSLQNGADDGAKIADWEDEGETAPGSSADCLVGFIKGRLIVAKSGTTRTRLYECVIGGAVGDTLRRLDARDNSWTWVSFQDGPSQIYCAGYMGDASEIVAISIDDATPEDGLQAPTALVSFPKGEVAYSMLVYASSFLVVGTNLGVRVGEVGSDGSLRLGPLSIETDQAVYALCAYGQWVFAGGAVTGVASTITDTALTYRSGLYKLDLSKQIPSEDGYSSTGLYPWHKSIFAASASTDAITSIVPIGFGGRLAYIHGDRLVYEESSLVVDVGWVETGRYRLDTLENKVFQFLRLVGSSTAANSVYFRTNVTSSWTQLSANWQGQVEVRGSDLEPAQWIQYRIYMQSSSGGTVASYFNTLQVRAQPSEVTQRNIRLTLLCFRREKMVGGTVIDRPVWDRVEQMEELERTRRLVLFEDHGTGETRHVYIDNVQFISEHVGETGLDSRNPGGLLVLTLRTVD